MRLAFDAEGALSGPEPRVFAIQVPFLFDLPPRGVRSDALLGILSEAARRIDTVAIVPLSYALGVGASPHLAPLVSPADGAGLERLRWIPRLVLLEGWDRERFDRVRGDLPDTIVGVRVPAERDLLEMVRAGVRVIQLVADEAGPAGGRFFRHVVLGRPRGAGGDGEPEKGTAIGSGG